MPMSRSWLFVAALFLAHSGAMVYAQAPAGHVVLLGDSIFDNGVYVGGKPAVIDQVREQLGDGWQATLLAIDGDVTDGVALQLRRLPEGATHLVISVGGNDALGEQRLLTAPAESAAEAFGQLAGVQEAFGKRYAKMLDAAQARGLPVAVCTIYDPRFGDRNVQRLSVAALSVFNDRITREAFRRGLPVIDLRVLFTRDEDYANPIEPGVPGGLKIAQQIKAIVRTHDFSAGRTVIYGPSPAGRW
ncbi:MAG: SGNH/GDSL hydrolase family protein [Planctomycetota bacterium]